MSGNDTGDMSVYKRGSEDSGCDQGDKRVRWGSEDESDGNQFEQPATYVFPVGEFMGKTVRVSKTRPPMPSAIDIIRVISDCDQERAQSKWTYQKKQEWAVREKFTDWKFPGERQRDTPVLTAKQVVKLINALPGAKASAFRDKCAEVFVRYLGGDDTLVQEIAANRAKAENNPNGVHALAAASFKPGELGYYTETKGMSLDDAFAAMDKYATYLERTSQSHPDILRLRAEAEKTERESVTRIAEERERRETLLAQQRLLHEQAREAQSLVKKLDERWYLMATANRVSSALARNGPCLYFVDDLNGGIMFGYTTRSMAERYKNDKLRSNITENVLLALAAPVIDGSCAARDMERAFKVLVAADAPAFRVVRAERLVDNYDAFSVVAGIWNTRIAPEYGWPVIDLP